MNTIYILLFMIFMHIIDDFRLQGIMASMKQRSWWENQEGYNDKYRFDYIPALLCHAFSWSMMIHLPILVYFHFDMGDRWDLFIIVIIVQFLWHAFIDNMKANWKMINLVEDQGLHMLQIIISWFFFILFIPF